MGLITMVPLFLIFIFLPWLFATLDLLEGKFEGTDRLVCFLLVSLFPLVGPLLYFAKGKKLKTR